MPWRHPVMTLIYGPLVFETYVNRPWRHPVSSPVSGLISSSSLTMPSPCKVVHCLIGEPPPIRLYCSWIFGVRRLAIKGPSVLCGEREIKLKEQSSCLYMVTTDSTSPSHKSLKTSWPFMTLCLLKQQ